MTVETLRPILVSWCLIGSFGPGSSAITSELAGRMKQRQLRGMVLLASYMKKKEKMVKASGGEQLGLT